MFLLRTLLGIAMITGAFARRHGYGAGCNGVSTPGPSNDHPILDAEPKLIKTVQNGSHYSVSQGDQEIDVVSSNYHI